jgi:hypothetical protein
LLLASIHLRIYLDRGLTATPDRPHFNVSGLMLLRLMCQLRGVTLSVAIYKDVSVCVYVRKISSTSKRWDTHLGRVQHLNHTRMAQSSQLLEGISCQWQPCFVRTADIEREYTAVGSIVLWHVISNAACAFPVVLTRRCPFCKTQIPASESWRSPKV